MSNCLARPISFGGHVRKSRPSAQLSRPAGERCEGARWAYALLDGERVDEDEFRWRLFDRQHSWDGGHAWSCEGGLPEKGSLLDLLAKQRTKRNKVKDDEVTP